MGVFSRVRDIVNSNLHSMLEQAEDPEKLIRLMIAEMEDALIEIKSTASKTMVSQTQAQKELTLCRSRVDHWADKAQLAVDRDRDDLARQALHEKKVYHARARALENELVEFDDLIGRQRQDVEQLEAKLTEAREKYRVLVGRYSHAKSFKQAQRQIQKVESSDAFVRFERLEQRVDHMEAHNDLSRSSHPFRLQDELDSLVQQEEIEKELSALKKSQPVDRPEDVPNP